MKKIIATSILASSMLIAFNASAQSQELSDSFNISYEAAGACLLDVGEKNVDLQLGVHSTGHFIDLNSVEFEKDYVVTCSNNMPYTFEFVYDDDVSQHINMTGANTSFPLRIYGGLEAGEYVMEDRQKDFVGTGKPETLSSHFLVLSLTNTVPNVDVYTADINIRMTF